MTGGLPGAALGWKRRVLNYLPAPLKRSGKKLALWWWQDDLTRLAQFFGTDKWGGHWYTPHYQRYFHSLRRRRLNVLEIGVGGYDDHEEGAKSLRMWKAYFPKSQIVGIDLYDKSHFSEHRIDVRQCDQSDSAALTALSQAYGGFDIIIDDGSHVSAHVITTFETLFPLLRDNGIYVIEDTQTSYWTTWGGGMGMPGSSLEYCKRLTDGLNHVEYPIEGYQPSYFDRHIIEMAFFHNMVVIRKGRNEELTNAQDWIEREIASLKTAESSQETPRS